jgi:hypothetical protein
LGWYFPLGTDTMKCIKHFTSSILLMLMLAGCASSGHVREASPITAQPFNLDMIWVKTSNSLADAAGEARTLRDKIISGLNDTHSFKEVSGSQAELDSGSGIRIEAEITDLRRVSKSRRLWLGLLAGQARILVNVTVSDLNTGQQIETFKAEGESSGGSARAGTTEEAIERAAEVVVGEVLKINARTAEKAM